MYQNLLNQKRRQHTLIYIKVGTELPTCLKYTIAQKKLITLKTSSQSKQVLLCYLPPHIPHGVLKVKCVKICAYDFMLRAVPRLCRALKQVSTPRRENAFHSEKLHRWTPCGPHQLLSTGCRKHSTLVNERAWWVRHMLCRTKGR